MARSARRPFKRLYLLCGAAILCGGIVTGVAQGATGDLDLTFNGTGKVLLPSGGNDNAWDVAVQPDGKIVAVGSTTSASNAMVWRYNSDGSPDLSFNAADTPGSLAINLGGSETAFAVDISPVDNKIVVSGSTSDQSDGFVARLNTNGTLDTAGFNSPDGIARAGAIGGFEQANDVAVLNDGRVAAVGQSGTTSSATLYVFTAAGAPDMSCSGDGNVSSITGTQSANAVDVDSAGNILVAGNTTAAGNGFVARFIASNCSLDSGNFSNPSGIAVIDSGGSEQVLGITAQPDNKPVAVGFSNTDATVYRLNTNGLPDTSFDTDGAAGIDSGGDERLQAVRVQPDGKLVVAGRTSVGGGDAAVYRLLANGGPGALNGALDTTFAGDGAIGVDLSGSDEALGLDLQSDGKAVAAGQSTGPTGFLFRLQGDPATVPAAPPGLAPTPAKKKKKCKKGKKLKKVKGKKKCVKKKKKKH